MTVVILGLVLALIGAAVCGIVVLVDLFDCRDPACPACSRPLGATNSGTTVVPADRKATP